MTELDREILPHKTDLIDRALAIHKIRSVVDLGACWGVNGGYSFHAMSKASEGHS